MARVLLFLLLMGLGAVAVSGQTNMATVTGADRLAVRRGPGKQFPPFASLTAGSKVEVEELQGEWARIVTGSGQRGYVHSNFLSISAAGTTEAGTSAAAATTGATTTTSTPAVAPGDGAATRALATELQAARTSQKKLESELQAANDRTKALQSALDAATTRGKALEAEVGSLRERGRTLETELQAAQGEITTLRNRTQVAGAPAPSAGEPADLQAQVRRLTAAVEALERRLGRSSETGASETTPETATDPPSFSGVAILLGLAGVAAGWMLGGLFGRKPDRRSRIRF
jgi:uncharacterized protein YgiM (DUF1202 family)